LSWIFAIADGRDPFVFNGKSIAPTIPCFSRRHDQDRLCERFAGSLQGKLRDLSVHGMRNLHFHGLAVSPHAPQDNAIDMLAKPGETHHYVLEIPANHPPGLFWYHAHPQGESQRQALDGMSGVIVIDGMDRYVSELGKLLKRLLVARGESIEHSPNTPALVSRVEAQAPCCGSAPKEIDRIYTVKDEVCDVARRSYLDQHSLRKANVPCLRSPLRSSQARFIAGKRFRSLVTASPARN
jgi:suppressor of ftsI